MTAPDDVCRPPAEVPASPGGRVSTPGETSGSHLIFRVVPSRIQAWREENELSGRDVMRDGQWLASTD
jgi:hypothetical protein